MAALLGLASLPFACQAQEGLAPIETATLVRPASPVIVPGARLGRLLKTPVEELRMFAWQDGALRAVPFQVDERTPEERYAYQKGAERRSDTDDGRIDANDELVFMARDVGPRLPPAAISLGQSAYAELVVKDPTVGQKGWVYLLHFSTAPPPQASRSYVALDWREGEVVGWSGDRVRIVGPPGGTNFLYFHQIRFGTGNGKYGPDVIDRAKLSLRASYLFLNLTRHFDEVRSELLSYSDGPVRIVATFLLETYLIWGHWLRTNEDTRRCQLTIYGDRFEMECEIVLPVKLEKRPQSQLRLSLDFAPSAGAVRLWSDRNPKGLRADGRRSEDGGNLDWGFPRWLCASFPSGSILARMKLSRDLERPGHSFYYSDERTRDPPEEVPGSLGNAGFVLDLTDMRAGTYRFQLVLQFGPRLRPGQEGQLLRVDDAPLQCEVVE